MEIQRLAEAGLPLPKSLAVPTRDSARAFGLEKDVGTVEAGKVANLLLLNRDPLESATAYGAIDRVTLRGKALAPMALSAKSR
ncbi:Amidohydrolase family protein [Sulfidibacter corallicola]|uniref:Amidohydrolase family protein n=1 Tax=Sulfidibacter corallicola TaxID=2818388 RepID=A0A8A4TSG7_SULCO|nr:amidohydrolase family protein [Sulfidibacter corallicola]QTD52453.1 amidohydrolase family protein [Sulfidibacter corallicola]